MPGLRVSIVTNAKAETAAHTSGLFSSKWEVLLQTEQELAEEIENVHVLIPGHITVGKDLIERGKKLKLIHCGTGYNNVDVETASRRGIYVAVTPNVAATSVAELVFAMILTLTKKLLHFDALMKGGGWKTTDFIGVPELKGKTFGIVGFGNIGRLAGRIARGFDMKVLAYDPVIRIQESDVTQCGWEMVLRDADFITLHVPLTKETTKLIGEQQLRMMKRTAVLVNASRGPVVDERALVQALQERRIGGACLDVFEKEPLTPDSPLRALDNVLLTPHVAYCANEALAGRYRFFAENCQRLVDGNAPAMVVNAEAVKASRG